MENGDKRVFRIEKRAPEGGYGILISISMALSLACAWGSLGSFGLIFNDFITSCGGESGATTLVIGFFASSLSFAGLFASVSFKKFSVRSVAIFGSLIYFLGGFLTIFVNSVEQLIVSYGIMQGMGIGIMLPASYATFNSYFIRRRVLMMSFAQTLVGVGTTVYPLMVQFLMEKYGFRGMLAVIAALNGHAIFGMLSMHPVKWHYEIIKILVDKVNPLLNSNRIENEINANKIPENDRDLAKIDEKDENCSQSLRNDTNYDVERNQNGKHKKSRDQNENCDEFDPTQRRVSSISITGIGGVIACDIPQPIKKADGTWQKVVDFLDLSLLKDLVYLNIVLGISFAVSSDGAFFALQPMYMFQLGLSKAETAVVVASGAAADLVSRLVLTALSLFILVNARYVFLSGAISTILLRFAFLEITDYFGMLVITAIMSFVRTWFHMIQPLVFADYLPPERFSSGFGQFMFLQGNFYFAFVPFAGWIRDVTQSYVICFHTLTFVMAMCAVPWLIEIVWLRMYPRNKSNEKKNSDIASC